MFIIVLRACMYVDNHKRAYFRYVTENILLVSILDVEKAKQINANENVCTLANPILSMVNVSDLKVCQ